MSPENGIVIEVFGEGKTDVGDDPQPQPPSNGVVPILLHTLCGRPARMMVKRRGPAFLQQRGMGKGLWQKIRFAKQQAVYNRSAAVVYVLDSEGDLSNRKDALEKGRNTGLPDFPMAVGVAHPCVEAWLLADARAIRRGLGLSDPPNVPDQPEQLPAPCQDRRHNPKTVLAAIAGTARGDIPVAEKERIARAMNDMETVRRRCPQGFAPFANEVEQHIRPLF